MVEKLVMVVLVVLVEKIVLVVVLVEVVDVVVLGVVVKRIVELAVLVLMVMVMVVVDLLLVMVPPKYWQLLHPRPTMACTHNKWDTLNKFCHQTF